MLDRNHPSARTLALARVFEKTATANILVLLDTVQYRKNYFQNRNRIHVNGHILWMTVPVKRESRVLIKDAQIDNGCDWKRRYWNKIHHGYARAPLFREYSPFSKNALNRSWERLAELNTHLLSELLAILGIKTQIVKASELNVTGDQQTLLLNLVSEAQCARILIRYLRTRILEHSAF